MNQKHWVSIVRVGLAVSALLVVGCGDGEDGGETGNAEIEIGGTWESSFGGTETISSEAWGDADVVSFDNDENVAITQNADDAEFNPGKFNRIVWTEPEDDSFYYCWVAFALDTEQEALDSDATADASAPDESGCGDFAWTKLSAP